MVAVLIMVMINVKTIMAIIVEITVMSTMSVFVILAATYFAFFFGYNVSDCLNH